MLRKIEN